MKREGSDPGPESTLRAGPTGSRRPEPLLIVLSGPSGVGKDALLSRMRELGRPLHYVVTATTRPRRAGETNGVDYHFISPDEFQETVDEGGFLEWAVVYGSYYGVPKKEILSALSKGEDTIVKVDVQGAGAIKRILPEAVFIFLMHPSEEELERRLRSRLSEPPADLKLRLKTAEEETKSLPLFDYAVTNYEGRIDDAVSKIDAIVTAEKCRVKPRVVKL